MTLSERDLARRAARNSDGTGYVRWLVLRSGVTPSACRRAWPPTSGAKRCKARRCPKPEAEEITLGSVSTQTRNILRALTAIAAI